MQRSQNGILAPFTEFKVMDASRQLGPQRQSDTTTNGQLNSGAQQLSGLQNNTNFALHHLPPHMQQQLNGPLVRTANMTVSQQQPPGTMTIQSPNSLQPGTVYLIRSPTGELQLVRLAGPPNPQGAGGVQQQRPGLPPSSNPQMQQNLRFATPGSLGLPHQGLAQHPNQSLSQGSMIGQSSISVPSGIGQGIIQQSQHHPSNHLPNNVPAGHMQMRPSLPTPAPVPASPNKMEDPLNKAKQFFNALLLMSKNQTPAMYSTARDLLQQLVDGKINPDMFAQRLQEELKSTPQPILAPLLKACLSKLREGLLNGEINIEGISPPPASALSLPDLSLLTPNMNPPFQGHTGQGGAMGNNIKHSASPEIPVRPPVAGSQAAPAKPKGGKNAQKAAAAASAAATAAGTPPPSSDLHPVFGQLPQLQTHQKTEKTKAVKPPAEKKITAKQKRDQLMKERRSQLEAEVAATAPPKEQKEQKELKPDEDELNDVAAMGGVNLTEESAKLATADIVGTQTRSIEDHSLLPGELMRKRLATTAKGLLQDDLPSDVLTLISHAVEARIRNVCERLNVIAEHRLESVKGHVHYNVSQDVKQQLKYIEKLSEVEKRRRDEEEKEALQRVAKSRNRPDNPDHMRMKEKAKEIQLKEQAELRTKESNDAALAALTQGGFRKRPRPAGGLDGPSAGTSLSGAGKTDVIKSQPFRPRTKRVCLRDVIFMAETDRKLSKSAILYGLLHQIK